MANILAKGNIHKTWKSGMLRGSIGLLLLFAAVFYLCAISASLEAEFVLAHTLDSQVTVTDSRGEKVSFQRGPQRIVALSFSSLEIVRLLGAVDRVVAVGTVRKGTIREQSVPEIENLVSLGSGVNPDIELLVSMKPDLVITWGLYPGEYLDRSLKPFGIKVLRLDFYKPQNFKREVKVLSEVLGGEAPLRAEEYIAWNRKNEERMSSFLSKVKKGPSVVVEHPYNGQLAGSVAGVFQLTDMLKVDNLAGIFKENAAFVDAEWILNKDPEFIVRLEHLEEARNLIEQEKIVADLTKKIKARPGWDELKAYKENKILIMDGDLATGPRYTVGLFFLGSIFYPDLVPKEEYKAINEEYFRLFQGLVAE
jgi:iron complex transport system substrate-binding protein